MENSFGTKNKNISKRDNRSVVSKEEEEWGKNEEVGVELKRKNWEEKREEGMTKEE